MKTRIFIIVLLGVFVSLSAQILEEGFESCYFDSLGETVLPEGWTMVDHDGDGSNWFPYSHAPHSGNTTITSASWTSQTGPLSPDNWLISPEITVADSSILSWWIAVQDFDFPVEHYSVMLSVNGAQPENFTTELFAETTDTLNFVWQRKVIDLYQYAGETINLAWRHHASNDQFYIKFDDILLDCGVSDNDVNQLIGAVAGINKVYPNPFNPETTVNFYMPEAGYAEIGVYNMKGQKVSDLHAGNLNSGEQRIVWQAGTQPSGVYFFRLMSDQGNSVSRAILIK